MPEEVAITPNSDERLMGALAHFFGLIAALVIWALQKDKSKYVWFQAVQALAFDFAAMLLGVVISICLMGVMFAGVMGSVFLIANSSSPDEIAPFFMYLMK